MRRPEALRLVGGGLSGGTGLSADAPDIGFVGGIDGALGPALVERVQGPVPVALDEEADDGFPAAPWVAQRVQPNAARPWVFRYRRDGKPRRLTLPKSGAVKADDTRPAVLPSSPARRAAAIPFAFLPPARRSRRSPPSKRKGARPDGSRPPGQRSGAISRVSSRPLSTISVSARSCAPISPASSRIRTQKAGRREPLS